MKANLIIKYFLFLYILAISSFEHYFRVTQPALYLLFPIVLLLQILYKKKYNLKSLLIIAPFVIAVAIQSFLYGTPLTFAVALFIRMLTIYLCANIIGKDFTKIFINTLKYISAYSIVFYLLQFSSSTHNLLLSICGLFSNPGSDPGFVVDRPNFIIYTVQALDNNQLFYRNFGPFWEPGLYVLFLNIALYMNLFKTQKLFNRTNILFLVSIISTFSTTGIIVVLLTLTAYYLNSKTVTLKTRIFWIVLMIFTIPVIWSLPFMNEKVSEQFTQSDVSYSRFGAAVVHWNIIQDYPWVGLPIDNGATFSKYTDSFTPNGLTEIFTIWGVLVGLIFYIFLYKSAKQVMKNIGDVKNATMLFLVMTISLFSENMGNRPIYILFLFLPLSLNYSMQKRVNVATKSQ